MADVVVDDDGIAVLSQNVRWNGLAALQRHVVAVATA